MDTKPEKRPRGRPAKEVDDLKKHRGLSLTDAEWENLTAKAKEAGFPGPSAYIVKKLKLSN